MYNGGVSDLASLWHVLNVVKKLPAFERMLGIQLAVLATPTAIPEMSLGRFDHPSLTPNVEDEVESASDISEEEAEIGRDISGESWEHPSDDTSSDWVLNVGFSVDDSVQLNAENRLAVWQHVFALLRPYAERRVRMVRDRTMHERPTVYMIQLRFCDLMSYVAAVRNVLFPVGDFN